MKTSRLIFIIVSMLLTGTLLSACAGNGGVATSWPGLTVDGETGYVAYNAHVYSVNLTNGTEAWRFPVEANNRISFFAAPTLVEGHLLVGSYNNTLFSLNPANGTENWTFTGSTNRFVASPLVQNERIYAPSSDGKLYVLDMAGKLIATPIESQHPLWATPATDGTLVYVPAMDHYVYAIDAESNEIAWQTEDLGGAVLGTPTIGPDGTLYIGTFAREMLALDSQSGKIKNRYSTQGWVWSGPTLDGERLYFGDLDGQFYALNAADLGEVWKVQPDTLPKQAISDRPLVMNGTVYVTSKSGNVYALDAASGTPRWTKTIGGQLHASPVASGDSILITPVGIDSFLVALDSNGNQKWTFPQPKQ